jgi:Holliday junction DNA helicase RuvB
MSDEMLTGQEVAGDTELEASLRPRWLNDFVGQPRIKEQLALVLEGARGRGAAVDHLLFSGPPGLGKTSLAGIVAAEMQADMRATSGPALERPGDLAAILSNVQPGDVLFIDEIHRLPRAVEEILYPAMEDFSLDIVVGKGPGARAIRLPLPPFTLVGATTRTGLITSPLRDRVRGAVGVLRARRPGRHPAAQRRHPRRRGRTRWRLADRITQPWHTTDRQPPAQARA